LTVVVMALSLRPVGLRAGHGRAGLQASGGRAGQPSRAALR